MSSSPCSPGADALGADSGGAGRMRYRQRAPGAGSADPEASRTCLAPVCGAALRSWTSCSAGTSQSHRRWRSPLRREIAGECMPIPGECGHGANLCYHRVRPLMAPRAGQRPSIGAAHAPDAGKTSQLRDLASGVAEGELKAFRMPAGRTATHCTHTRHCGVSNEISNASLEL
jgi:hypothetical protein